MNAIFASFAPLAVFACEQSDLLAGILGGKNVVTPYLKIFKVLQAHMAILGNNPSQISVFTQGDSDVPIMRARSSEETLV